MQKLHYLHEKGCLIFEDSHQFGGTPHGRVRQRWLSPPLGSRRSRWRSQSSLSLQGWKVHPSGSGIGGGSFVRGSGGAGGCDPSHRLTDPLFLRQPGGTPRVVDLVWALTRWAAGVCYAVLFFVALAATTATSCRSGAVALAVLVTVASGAAGCAGDVSVYGQLETHQGDGNVGGGLVCGESQKDSAGVLGGFIAGG